MQTNIDTKALEESIVAGKVRRTAMLAEIAEATRIQKLQSEAKIVEIEASTGLILGENLGVVWCNHGKIVLVKKASAILFDKYQAASALDKENDDRLLTEMSQGTVVYPPQGTELEAVYADTPQARHVGAALACNMCTVDQSTLAKN